MHNKKNFLIFDKEVSKLFFAFDNSPNLFSEIFFRDIQEQINNLANEINRKIKYENI